jgi:pectinesterase inhibitor-like protein
MGRPNAGQIPPLIIIIVSLFSLIFFNSAQALCVPRNFSSNQAPPKPKSPPKKDPPASHVSAPSPPSELASPPFSSETQTFIIPPSPGATPPTRRSHHKEHSRTPPSGSTSSHHKLPPSPIHKSMNPAIKKICATTDNPSLCLSSIAPFLFGKSDPLSVLAMAIKASLRHTKKAMSKASQLAAGADPSPSVEDCKDSYSDALDNFQNAMDAIHPRDIGTINSMLSAALTDFDTCEDGFSGDSPLSFYDDKGSKLASICLAIASLVK